MVIMCSQGWKLPSQTRGSKCLNEGRDFHLRIPGFSFPHSSSFTPKELCQLFTERGNRETAQPSCLPSRCGIKVFFFPLPKEASFTCHDHSHFRVWFFADAGILQLWPAFSPDGGEEVMGCFACWDTASLVLYFPSLPPYTLVLSYVQI